VRRIQLFVATAVACLCATSVLPAAEGRTQAYCAGPGDVTFRAADRTRLLGHSFGRGEVAVVLAHESRSSLCQWVPYARRLAAQGYRVFAFDFRNHGRSQRVGIRRSQRISADVTAAIKYVRARGATKVFVVGASMGGAAVLTSAANIRPPIDGVVALSSPLSFAGADAESAVRRLQTPVLLLAAEDDGGGGFAMFARALHEGATSPDKTLEVLPGAFHGVGLVSGPGRARDLVEQFLRSRASR
jgi:alpha-beta hydrolase superfamily lysophospholipase